MKKLNFPPACASMGPFPLQDDWGMKGAIAVLDKSLDPGKYEETVQAKTFRKVRRPHQHPSSGECWRNGRCCWGLRTKTGVNFECLQTLILVFHRFHGGNKTPAWSNRQTGLGHPIAVLHAVEDLLEKEWRTAKNLRVREKVAEIGNLVHRRFCSGMQGEEMILVELAGTANSLRFFADPSNLPHFVLWLQDLPRAIVLVAPSWNCL